MYIILFENFLVEHFVHFLSGNVKLLSYKCFVNACDLNIDQNNRDYVFFPHNLAAL